MEITYPDYYEALDALSSLSAQMYRNPSYVHGLLTGHICFGLPFRADRWISEQTGEKNDTSSSIGAHSQDIMDTLTELYQASVSALEGGQLDFILYLPDEDEELVFRLAGLTQWCSGFISVYKQVSNNLQLDEEVKEALDYMNQVIEIDLEINDTEEEEKLFFEIYEYLRLSAIMVFMAVNRASSQQSERLH